MDRLDAMRSFLTAIDDGSLAAAGRRLGRSPAAMTRAIAALEAQIGAPLFERNTRIVRLTETGERYADSARRILAELDRLQGNAATPDASPRGVLTLTAPLTAGAEILRPVVGAFLDDYADVQARLLLFDRIANLVDEGFDAALRIGHLPDSRLVALRLGDVRHVVCAAPSYLAQHRRIREPGDLAAHAVIALAESGAEDHWTFPASGAPRTRGRMVRVRPRLSVNTIAAAKASAIEGAGIARLFSYQVADDVRAGRLKILLEAFEPAHLPVHLIAPKERLAAPKTRCFFDFAAPRVKAAFADRLEWTGKISKSGAIAARQRG